MLNFSEILEEGDPNDLTQGFIGHKAFNPYRAHTRRMTDFVCPNSTTFPSEGYYGSSGTFVYSRIRINRCSVDDMIEEPDNVDE